jgi:hypothetical protein
MFSAQHWETIHCNVRRASLAAMQWCAKRAPRWRPTWIKRPWVKIKSTGKLDKNGRLIQTNAWTIIIYDNIWMNQMIEDSGILIFFCGSHSQWSKFWLISTYPQGPDDIFPTPALSVPAKKRLARPDRSQSPSLCRRFLAVLEKNYKCYMNMISSG